MPGVLRRCPEEAVDRSNWGCSGRVGRTEGARRMAGRKKGRCSSDLKVEMMWARWGEGTHSVGKCGLGATSQGRGTVPLLQSLCLSVSLSVSLSISVSVSTSFYLSFSLYVCLCLYVSLSILLSPISLPFFFSLNLSLCVSISLHLSLSLSLSLSLPLSMSSFSPSLSFYNIVTLNKVNIYIRL